MHATSTARTFAVEKPVKRADENHSLLWRRFRRSRSDDARNRLLETYLPLLRGIAARVLARLPPYVDAEDLRSAGVFGLLDAIEHFDPDRGVKFETYCRKRVSGAMLDELRRQDPIPRETRERAGTVKRAVAKLQDDLQREPSPWEVARALGLSLATFRRLLTDVALVSASPSDLAFDADDGEDSHGSSDEPEDAFPGPSEIASRREVLQLAKSLLSAAERTIVRGYYHDEQSMKRIGGRLRLSESRVCQMHARMLSRLKTRLCHLER